MKHRLALLCVLGSFLNSSISSSQFQRDGDYLLGGLFNIHHVTSPVDRKKPEAIHCSRWVQIQNYARSKRNLKHLGSVSTWILLLLFFLPSHPFLLANYRMFQIMRFAVEEINNSTKLLPNVSLGFELFDHCSDIQSFPEIYKLISTEGLVHGRVKSHIHKNTSKVIGVVGAFSSTQTLTVAPLLMMDFMPMVSLHFCFIYLDREINIDIL